MRKSAAKARKLARILCTPQWRKTVFRWRVAAATEHEGVLRGIPTLNTVVDVGANRGQFALVARHCFPEASIVAFEPLALPATTWRAVFRADIGASLVEAALGPTTGRAVIYVAGRDDSSSLLPITSAQNDLFPGTAQIGTQTITVSRLIDHLPPVEIESPALLKIDVQGYELQVLAGCEDVLERFAWVYVECSFVELYRGQSFADEVIAWLRDRGFRLYGIYNLMYAANRAVQGDFLFARK